MNRIVNFAYHEFGCLQLIIANIVPTQLNRRQTIRQRNENVEKSIDNCFGWNAHLRRTSQVTFLNVLQMAKPGKNAKHDKKKLLKDEIESDPRFAGIKKDPVLSLKYEW